MIPASIALLFIVGIAAVSYAQREHSLAEWLVDRLYIRAARAYALAQAADAALAKYREAKRSAITYTIPIYMEEPR